MDALKNLVKINQLHKEAPNQAELNGMLAAAKNKLQDVKLQGLSKTSQFTLAYGAAQSLAFAALRWCGYRSENRYLVFQCLVHTTNLEAYKVRVLDECHRKRNLAEYEGHLEIEDALLNELISITEELLISVEKFKEYR